MHAGNIDQLSATELQSLLKDLLDQHDALKKRGLALDLTRGKPCTGQVELSDSLDGILQGNYLAADGTDTRNYGGLEGLPEARALFGSVLGLAPEETLVGGNSSLTMMYQVVAFALSEGLRGTESAWGIEDTVKFLCPVPGYDRHFAICEHLGIEMVTVPMLDTGPDMDVAEAMVKEDESIKGIWCVPRFSNPTGCVYSDETVRRIATLPKLASEHFLVLWDNAYAVHTVYENAPELASISDYCHEYDTLDNVFQFGSTSKVTLAGAGVAFLGSSIKNLAALTEHLGYQMIGPDKINQLRHVRFLRDRETLDAHMAMHARFIRPRFDTVLNTLENELGGADMGHWTKPGGGYFISFNTRPGLANEVVRLAAAIGVKLTPAGATYPYGLDPQDSNIRLSPTFPTEQAVSDAMAAFVVCVRLATVRQQLQQVT